MGALYRFSYLYAVARNRHCVVYVSSKHVETEGGGLKGRAEQEGAFIPSGKVAPFFVNGLFLNERLKIELRVELVGLCTGVREDPLLVEVFGDLNERLL